VKFHKRLVTFAISACATTDISVSVYSNFAFKHYPEDAETKEDRTWQIHKRKPTSCPTVADGNNRGDESESAKRGHYIEIQEDEENWYCNSRKDGGKSRRLGRDSDV